MIPTRLTPRHHQVKYLQLGGGFGGPENDVVLETQLQHKHTNYFKKHLASANLEAYDTVKHIRIELIAQIMTAIPKTMKAIRLVKVFRPKISVPIPLLFANLGII